MFGDVLKSSGSNLPIDLSDGLVSHYLLNNNSNDSAGVNDGTDVLVTYTGDVAVFDILKTDVHIDTGLPAINDNTGVAVSMWIKPNEAQPEKIRRLFSNHQIKLNFSHSNIQNFGTFEIRQANGDYRITTIPNTLLVDTLYHIVCVADADTLYIYIDGVLSGTETFDGTYYSNEEYPLLLGATMFGDIGGEFDGEISNVRIYSDAKSQRFITALYNEGYYPKPLPLPTTEGLIAHYPLTGTAEDSTGNYDGTENSVTYVDDDEVGSVASFDGVDDYVDVLYDTIDTRTNFTVSLWFKLDVLASSVGSHLTLFSDTFDNNEKSLWLNINKLNDLFRAMREVGGNIQYSTTTTTTVVDAWYHVVACVDATGDIEVFINNISESTNTAVGPLLKTTQPEIGRQGGAMQSDVFDGEIRNTRFYNRALTSTEVEDIYNYEKNFRHIDIDDGLIAYYPLENNSLDNYHKELDGVDSGGVTYDGDKATIPNGDNITFTAASGFVEAYYTIDGNVTRTTTESTVNTLDNCTLKDVRKYNKLLSVEQQLIIGYIA